jgi:hypothetical protein
MAIFRPFLFLDDSMKSDMTGTGLKASAAATQISAAESRSLPPSPRLTRTRTILNLKLYYS